MREGRLAEAEHGYRRVLQAQPENAEALQFLGNTAHARGDQSDAVNLLSRAARADPANVDILVQLGICYRAAERFDAARYVLERAVRLAAGRNALARLTLANLLELDQRPELALLHYFLALREVRQTGNFGPLVEHAERYVATGRRAWFERALRQRDPGATGWRDRVDRALAMYLGGHAPQLADARQQAGFMYLPDLSTSCFLDAAGFAWLDRAAGLIAPCIGEMDACIESSAAGSPGVAAHASRVSVFQRGVLQYEARRHAPRLQRVLAELPLARVPHHAPDVEIISLRGGARLPRHYGRTNWRCWAILNPADSAGFEVIVAGESRSLGAGGTMVLDGSFGVEYANGGQRSARALVVEAWHPGVAESEQQALCALTAAAVDFDIALQELN